MTRHRADTPDASPPTFRMKKILCVLCASVAPYVIVVAAGQDTPALKDYKPVTAQRLLKPEDGDWLMIRRTYDGWGYSPLEKINTRNVRRLKPVWWPDGRNARPRVGAHRQQRRDVRATPNNQVIAFDAKTGAVLWRYKRPRVPGAIVPHDTSRGVALYGDKVYFAGGEAVVVALDAQTGKEVWTATVADNKAGYYISLAPLVADGKVMVGTSGGEYGVRGFVAALDPDTGKESGARSPFRRPGEPGQRHLAPRATHWKTGGAPIWVTGNYDPETNLAFWGTGNGGPWMGISVPVTTSIRRR